MKIQVNGISIENTKQGFPFWFHLSDGHKTIAFDHLEAKAVYDALGNCIDEVKLRNKENEK